MQIDIHQVDAFTNRLFQGNPAAVCLLPEWLSDSTMQNIAAENNLSETAFLVAAADKHEIRWFTPTTEVDLCGHATLASAFVLFHFVTPQSSEVQFESRSGPLSVSRRANLLVLDFPSQPPTPCPTPQLLAKSLGVKPLETLKAEDYIVVFESESDIRELNPDFTIMEKLDIRGVAVTAPGDEYDFVSRFFAPNCGIDEDPVTGSAHCQLTPYWANRLGKKQLSAAQLSTRGGILHCEFRGDRVRIAGQAVHYMQGTITVA